VSASTRITLRVRDEVGVERTSELARGGVPLAAGTLTDPANIRLLARDGSECTVQSRVLERWGDGSIRWLGVALLADVAPQGVAEYVLEHGSSRSSVAARVTVVENPAGLAVDTGAASFVVRRSPFDPLEGFPGLAGFELATLADGRRFVAEAAELQLLEAGPVVARIRAVGTYRHEGRDGLLDFELELVAVAGSAEVTLDCRFVNRETGATASIDAWTARLACVGAEAACAGAFDAIHRTCEPFALRQGGEGHPRGIFVGSQIEPAGVAWEDASEASYKDRWEWSELSGLQAKGWVDVELSSGARFALTVPRFFDDNPSRVAYTGDGVEVGLWPPDSGPLVLTQGVAATRRLAIRAHTGRPTDASRFAERVESPLVVEAIQSAFETAAVGAVLQYRPERYPNLESYVRAELFSWCLVGQATGFIDRGDCMQVPVGPRAGFTANNEHDAILALCLHYLRSGERAYLVSAQSYADHVVDVDIVHASTHNDFEAGGVRAHGRNHVHYVPARTAEGATETSLDTGHMWVEGLLLLGALTDCDRYIAAARGIGDCLLRLEQIGWARPEPGPRNSGWPLVALAALSRATGDERYLHGARRIANSAIAAQKPDGRWTMRLGFWDGYCAWQNSVLLTGLARLLAVDPEPKAILEASFRAGAEALLDLGRYEDGGFVYLDRYDYRWVSRTGLIREALAAAYDVTGEERYLHAGIEGGDAWYRPSGGVATSNDVAEWRGHLPFLGALDRAGLLQDLRSASVPASAA
jgi:hypothetical protein